MAEYTICPDLINFAKDNPHYIYDILMVFIPDNSHKVCIDYNEKMLNLYKPFIEVNRDLSAWFSWMCAREELSFVKIQEDKSIENFTLSIAKQSYDKYLIVNQKNSYKTYKKEIDENNILILDRDIAKINLNYHPSKSVNFYPETCVSDILNIVCDICDEFKHLTEHNGLYKLLYNGSKRVLEKKLQMVFFFIAIAFCKANDLKISPEVDSGSGPVDFNVSKGFVANVNVELKFADNPKLQNGLRYQLIKYNQAERTKYSVYLVVFTKDKELKKITQLLAVLNYFKTKFDRIPILKVIDGRKQQSASKLTA